MKFTELSQKPKTELQRILIEQKERLQQLKFDLTGGKVKNVKEIHQTKKDIARILTILQSIKK